MWFRDDAVLAPVAGEPRNPPAAISGLDWMATCPIDRMRGHEAVPQRNEACVAYEGSTLMMVASTIWIACSAVCVTRECRDGRSGSGRDGGSHERAVAINVLYFQHGSEKGLSG